MRILQLRFKHLNSLEGCWHIDLEHPAFTADGIFAITGPTGAGKTTILDALCLALYGRTPRLPRLTKSANELMSRRRGECFAEVLFATPSGRYRCHWSQRRARKRPDGELQPPKHELVDAKSGAVLEATLRGVAERVEALTGMDFDRFTRSMLLAQGGFAAFLQAAPDERAPILEQITGTEIYSRISIRVHEHRQREREKLQLLQAEGAGITLLEPEQEEAIRQTLVVQEKTERELGARATATEQAMAWLGAIETLQEELLRLAGEQARLQNDLQAFAPERDRLDQALRAASLDATHATLIAARRQQVQDAAALEQAQAALPALAAALDEASEALQRAGLQRSQARAEVQKAAPLLQQLRTLDQQLAARNKTVLEAEEDCTKDAAAVAAQQEEREREAEKHAGIGKNLAGIEAALQAQAQDAWLVANLTALEEQVAGLLLQDREILRRQGEREGAAKVLAQAEQTLAERQRHSTACRQALARAGQELHQARDALEQLLAGRLLREYRAQKEALLRELALSARIAELESLREKLEDGLPCPLCGANEHPFARGNVPLPSADEDAIAALGTLIDRAEEQEAAIERLGVAERLAQNTLAAAEQEEVAAGHEQRAAAQALAEKGEIVDRLRSTRAQGVALLLAKVRPQGLPEPGEQGLAPWLADLKKRLQAWQQLLLDKATLEKELAASASALQRLEAVIHTRHSALCEKRARLEAMHRELAADRSERLTRYGDTDPEKEEARLAAALAGAEAAEQLARERHDRAQQQWQAAKGQAQSLHDRSRAQEPELRRLESAFTEALAPLGFPDEAGLLRARLEPAQRDALAARARELDERSTELKARQQERETRLATERARQLSDQPLDLLAAQHTDCQRALQELREEMAANRHILRENRAAAERLRSKRAAIAAQQTECRRWEDLHALIGSADGKKYRNFAQGLTFERMVAHANRQLRTMTDRYLLIRDPLQPLELNVVDSYQAGEIRSTKNLSGGESFIVSLALALGLSRMAGRTVRVDSLFLDEGFGTLDEDSLDTALETLAGLRREGKLIGVISHVAALQERIATQILVSPQSGGTSRLSGPGCRRVGSTEDER